MPSLLPGFEYDIFISYRQNDNQTGWVAEFVKNLQDELAATIKDPVSVYFDSNPHDGLLDTHKVEKSLEGKLKCLIFIPILSHTYCDPKSFAWNNEFLPFCKLAKSDSIGMDVRLSNRNVASRIFPIQIHDLNNKDQALFEKESGGPIRAIDFIFKSHGVNRPLTPHDGRQDNQNKTFYRDQLNKTANAIEQIIEGLSLQEDASVAPSHEVKQVENSVEEKSPRIWTELYRRNVWRALFVYILSALIIHQFLIFLIPYLKIEERYVNMVTWVLIGGFILTTGFAYFFEFSPSGFIRINSPQSLQNPFPPHRKKPFTSTPLISILILALILQFFYFINLKPALFKQANSEGDTLISIAVLPFENRSGNENDRYIAEGITDDIINRLTIISKLKVTNRKRSTTYQGKLLPLDEIAKDLEVQVLLTGSLERHDNQIAIRAQLLDENNTYLWGDTFQRTTENIMAVQSEIALVIAEQLKVQLNEMERTRLNLKATDNPTAYDYYLRGRSYYYQYRPTANDSAITQFKRAIRLDPYYARAWAGLGDALAQNHGRFAREYFWTDSSIVAGERAIEIDSTLSDGYKALAAAYNYRDDYEKALPLLIKAVELNPTNDQAIGNLGTTYLLKGDLPMALRWQKKGVGMDPKNWIPYQLIGWIYRLLGDFQNAESWLLKSLVLDPMQYDTYELLGYTYVAQGRKQEALNLIPKILKIGENETRVLEVAGLIAHYAGDTKNAKKYFQLSIENNQSYKEDHFSVSPIGLGQILLSEGNTVDAEVYLSHGMENNLFEITNGSKNFDFPFNLACIYAIRGNKAQSLNWLQKAIDLNWVDYTKIEHGPYFEKFRNDTDLQNKLDYVRKKTEAMLLQVKEY